MSEIREIRIDFGNNPFHQIEECNDCGSTLLAIESNGPLTNWVECGECGLWHPTYPMEGGGE